MQSWQRESRNVRIRHNCTDPNGGWALGCRIDGGQAEFVRVPYADQGLNKIPDSVTDEQALFVGDVLATGFWAARISEITAEDTVLIIGAGPTGICTLLCVMLKAPKRIIVCEKDPARIAFVREHYPEVLVCEPEDCKKFTLANSDHGGADVVLEVAGAKDTFRLAWDCARPNAIVTVVALYDEAQTLPLPDMYGKNLVFKTGGVDGCDCAEILSLIEAGKIDLNMPKWSIIWVVGLLSMVQDMTIDPVYVHDTYVFDGIAQGHWNWKIYYDTTFFGIPFFNFSSWFYMTGLYAGLLVWGRHIYARKKKEWIGTAYPFLSAVLLLVPLIPTALLLVKPIYSDNATYLFWYELIAMIVNFAFGAWLIAKHWKKMSPVNIKKDGTVIFAVPAILHLYDIVVGFGLGIEQSYIPVVVFTVLHLGYLFAVYRKSKTAVMK